MRKQIAHNYITYVESIFYFNILYVVNVISYYSLY